MDQAQRNREGLATIAKLFLACAIFTLGFLLLCGPIFDLRMERFHATREEATALDGAITQGWLPSQIPASAIDIHERHDLDVNSVIFTFAFEPGDLEDLRRDADRVSRDDMPRAPRYLTRGRDWWSPPSARRSDGLLFLKLQGPVVTWWITVDEEAGRAWGTSTRNR